MTKHIIDTDAQPNCSEGYTIKTHSKGGNIEWDPEKVSLYLSETQNECGTSGYNIQSELDNMPVLNACVLDYLIKNPNLIPADWVGKSVLFWGTIYTSDDSNLWVRCLCCDGSNWAYSWTIPISSSFDSRSPAVLLQVD